MNDKNNKKTQENKHQSKIDVNNHIQNNDSGTYLRDDHCDWGSSGMNEFTNEFGKD